MAHAMELQLLALDALTHIPIDPAARIAFLSQLALSDKVFGAARMARQRADVEVPTDIIVAGKWVLDRFARGNVVIALPPDLNIYQQIISPAEKRDTPVLVLRPGRKGDEK